MKNEIAAHSSSTAHDEERLRSLNENIIMILPSDSSHTNSTTTTVIINTATTLSDVEHDPNNNRRHVVTLGTSSNERLNASTATTTASILQSPSINSSPLLKYQKASGSSTHPSTFMDSLIDQNYGTHDGSISTSCGSISDQEDELIATTTTTFESEDEMIEFVSLPKLPSSSEIVLDRSVEKKMVQDPTRIQDDPSCSQPLKKPSPRPTSTWMISKHLSFTSTQQEIRLNTSSLDHSNATPTPTLEMRENSQTNSSSSDREIPTIITDQASHSSSSLSLQRTCSLIQHPHSSLSTYSRSTNSIQSASKINIHTLSDGNILHGKIAPKKGKVLPENEEVESINSGDTPKPARIFHQSTKFYRVSSFSSVGTDSTTASQKLRSKTSSFNSNQYVNLQKKGKPILKKSKSSSEACYYIPQPLISDETATERKIYFNEQVQIREFRTLYEGGSRRMYRFSYWTRNVAAHVILLSIFTILCFTFLTLFIFGNSFRITCDTDYMKYFLLSDLVNCLSFMIFFIFLIIFQCREGKRRRKSKRPNSSHPQKAKSKKKPVVKKDRKFVHQDSFSLYRNLFGTSISLEPLKDEESVTSTDPSSTTRSSKFKLSPQAQTIIGIVTWILLHLWGLLSLVSIIDAGNCPTGLGLVYYVPNTLHFTVVLLLSLAELTIFLISILR
ncbi:hypothetical protein C9374_005104 [Naegleria lovaniensis]|uniref:Uncharacterized protein n=1 Tax=Naegleria lovaniensis TaxID=51637 RepID=A0AA88GNV8_NAELO|nr:uncharacterized protein C9374_005104 [Naegleria lovaniensis]KAG2382524.1 hypothetical protein C9374_005104 [Naegleria lovaniensis]